MYPSIFLKDSWRGASHFGWLFSHSFPKSGSLAIVNLDMNWFMCYAWPMNSHISFSSLGDNILTLALILEGSSTIHGDCTTYYRSSPNITVKMYFCGFKHML